MIPANPNLYLVTQQNENIQGQWLYPDNRVFSTELVDMEMGGVAIQDPSLGLQVQPWLGYWDSTTATAYLHPDPDSGTTSPIAIFTDTGIIEFSFAFDQNMRWITATRKAGDIAQLRWYDSTVEAYVTTTYTGVSTLKLCHDDKRAFQVNLGNSDVIFTYLSGGLLRWRLQRDRFLTQYTKATPTFSGNFKISHFGMSTKNRLQWRIGRRHI